MNINDEMVKITNIFLELGFHYETIGERQYRYLVYNNCYCRITYLEMFAAFVIEAANNISDAANGVLEDGDLYFTDIAEDAMLQEIREDVIKYYME